jgi:hypothetical protein
MFCRQCGAPNADGIAQCVKCGAVLTPPLPRTGDIGQDAGMRMLLPVGRSPWAIAAGYAGLFAFIIFPAPLALVLGIMAIIDIKKHPDRHGMGRAIFGLVAGILGTIFLVLAIAALLARK